MEFTFWNPFKKGEWFDVRIVTEEQHHDYVKTLSGLAFAPGGIVINQKSNPVYRQVATNDQLRSREMQGVLKADGLTDITSLRVGTRIVIEQVPGISVTVTSMLSEGDVVPLFAFGGRRTTIVDGKVVKQSFPRE